MQVSADEIQALFIIFHLKGALVLHGEKKKKEFKKNKKERKPGTEYIAKFGIDLQRVVQGPHETFNIGFVQFLLANAAEERKKDHQFVIQNLRRD